MSENIRLDKFISSQLNISRSDAKKLIKKSSVAINGSIIKKTDYSFDPYADEVTYCGKKIEYKKCIYIMLNKPKGVVSASTDSSDKTVIDILPDNLNRNGLFPAGRLDKNTTGFVLITDDGEFAHNILSPAHHVKKTYIAEVETMLDDFHMDMFSKGMVAGNVTFKPAEIRFLEKNSDNGNFAYEVKIIEGRYHQIKRMFAFTGHPVLELRRISIGSLSIDSTLKPGEARELTLDELNKIYDLM